MMIPTALLLAIIGFTSVKSACDKDLLLPIEWTGGPLAFPDPAVKTLLKSSGKYICKNIIGTRAQIVEDTAIVALPRFKPGNPVTLAKVSLKLTGCEATLVPFPCLSLQEEGNCKALQSVVDIVVDPQNILWVLDIGVVNSLDAPIRRCPPKVVALSLKTGRIVKTVDLSGLVAPASRLQYLAVEYAADGRPFAYVSDAATRSILVFDIAGNRGYRVVLPQVITSGCKRRDVLYVALVQKGCGNNFLIFTYLCANRVFAIRTDYLRAGSTAGRIVDLGRKPNKIVLLGTDLGAAVFFRYEGERQIYRWDANTPFISANFLPVYKSAPCFLATQVLADLKRQRMRVLQSNFADYLANTVGCGAVQQINLLAGSC